MSYRIEIDCICPATVKTHCALFLHSPVLQFTKIKCCGNVHDDKITKIYEPRGEKTAFCICKNKDADQFRGNREADQRLCFRYMDSTIPFLSKSEISSL